MNFEFIADKPLEKYKKSDLSIVLLSLLLWGIGIVTLYICSGSFGQRSFGDPLYFVKRQLVSSLLGFVLFTVFAVTSMETIKKWLPLLVLTALVLSFLTAVPGIGLELNGARRWLKVGPLTFQASEFVKFIIVLYLANYFEKQSKIPDVFDRTVFPAVLLTFFMVVSVAIQQDMSTSVFISALAIVLFVISGSKIFWLVPVMTIVIPLCVLFIFLEPYRLHRVIGFLDQGNVDYIQTYNYQVISARKAISAGGFWGQGLGSGLMKINSIPEVQSDYIFAGWVESMGFVGVITYFALLALFAWRGLVCAVSTTSRFAAVSAFGFVAAIVSQSVLNVAVVGGLVPTTGIPLPFFSQGGSSILFTLAMCGFLVNASRVHDDYENVNIEEVLYE